MSATLSGPIVLENPRPVEGSTRSVEFEGQMWLNAGNVLTGKFRYFNTSDNSFDDIGYYFAWIHVAKTVSAYRDEAPAGGTRVEGGSDEQGGSDSDTLPEDFHVCGDIVQLIPCAESMIRHPPYITFSGAAFNRAEASFDVNAPQYTSFFKTQRNLSTLPIRAHFDETRYKNKKPLPSNNTYVAVEGFVTEVEIDSDTAQPYIFHISVDNISFLGKAVLPANGSQTSPSTPRSTRLRYSFDSAPSSPSQQADTTSSQPSTPLTVAEGSSSKRKGKRNRNE